MAIENFKFANIIAALLLLCNTADADESESERVAPSDFGISGYISTAGMKTSDYVYEAGSPDGGLLTEAGINMSYDTNTPVSLLMGINYKNTRSEDKVILEYGFMEVQAYKSLQSSAGFRAGRVKAPAGFYNEARSNPRARPTIMLPQTVYFGVFSDIADIVDGWQAYYTDSFSNGIMLNTSFTSGTLRANGTQEKDLTDIFYGMPLPGHLEFKRSYSVNAQIEYSKFSFNTSYAKINADYLAPGFPLVMSTPIPYMDHSIHYNYSTAGIKYSVTPDLRLTYETLKVDQVKTTGSFLPIGDIRDNTRGYYTMVQWNFLPEHRLTYVYARAKNSTDLKPYLLAFGVDYDDHSSVKQDTFNYTWKINPKWTFKAERSLMTGTTMLTPSKNQNYEMSRPTPKWNINSVAIMYEF